MGRRTAGILTLAILSTAALAPAAPVAAAVARKKVDACSLITEDAVGTLDTPFEISSAEPLTSKGCEYQLQGTGSNDSESGPLILTLESPKIYKTNKAIVHKAKSVSGLGGGAYQAIDGAGNPVVGFKGKKQGVTLAGGFDAPILIAIAKTFSDQIK